VCVHIFALSGMQSACAILSFLASVAVPYLSTSHKRHDIREKITKHKMCFHFLYNFCLKRLSFYEEFSEAL